MKLKITFLLKSGQQKELPIIALVSYGYKEFNVSKEKFEYLPLRYYTGLHISPSNWDKNYGMPTVKEIRDKVSLIEKHIRDAYQYLTHDLLNEFLNPKQLKDALDQKLKGKTKVDIKRIRIVDFITNELLKDESLKQSAINRVTTISNFIEDFEKKNGRVLYANDFDDDTFKSFIECYRNREGVTRNNSVWSLTRQTSVILNKISSKYKVMIYNPTIHLKGKDKISKSNEQKIFFDMKLIRKIIESEPTDYKTKQVRMILLTLIFTGVRYSDVFKIRDFVHYENEDISFDYAKIVTSKTNTEVYIPILKPLAEAFEKYGGTPLNMSLDSFNILVKDYIEGLEFTEQISLPYTNERGQKSFESRPFYKFASSHVGRRSFITNLINFMPKTILSKMTTHEMEGDNQLIIYDQNKMLNDALAFLHTLKQIQTMNPKHFIFDWV